MGLVDILVTLRQKMTTNAALSSAVTGIFDEEAPRDQEGPYLVIGHVAEQEGRLIADSERRGTVRIHVWSALKSKLEALRLFDQLNAAVTDDVFLFEDFELLSDPSSGWAHGVVTYRFYYDRGNS